MNREDTFNFSAGPSVLPTEVLEIAGRDILNFGGSGMSVMEMSHRSKVYLGIFESVKAKAKAALSVPDTHEVLFLQGGASSQFSMVPMNLIPELGKGGADYAVTGNFSNIAMKEAKKYCDVHIAANSEDKNHTYIPQQSQLDLSADANYFYYCANNTIYGTEWNYVPETGKVPLVCDMSSDILSKPVDVSKYGIIFAGAQKNMAPAGLTFVIIRKDLAGHEMPCTPLMMNYQTMIEKDSMYNTPPCWNIYMLGLVLDCTHVGRRSTLDIIEASTAPVIFSHSNPKALNDNPRNIDDARLRQLQEIVGGHIEAVSLPGERCMVINENGKDGPHMVNHTATAIMPTDYIAGVAVILPAEVLQ